MGTEAEQHKEEIENELRAFELTERRWAMTKQRWELIFRFIVLGLVAVVVIVLLIRGTIWLPSIAGLGTVLGLVRRR
jgi:hypothetical protein